MEWHMGTIGNALSNANQKDFLFLVFIDGMNALSARLESLFIDDRVCNQVTHNNIKVLRIFHGSESFKNFVATYKTVPIPSIFLLDRFGEPIDLITSDISSSEALAEKLDHVITQLRPTLHLTPPHFDLSVGRAFVTQISSSSISSNADSNEENYLDHSETLQTVFLAEEEPSQEQNMSYEATHTKRTEIREVVPISLEGGQDISDNTPHTSAFAFCKLPKECKTKNIKNTALSNLIFRFESGDTRSQYFSHTTPFESVRQYVSQVMKRESDIKDFYMSTTFPSRVLVPELDKVSLQDLGLYPSAMINVHFSKADRQRNGALSQRKTILEQIGGLTTAFLIAIWAFINPIMVGTNWLGLGEYFLMDADMVDEYGGFFRNIFTFQEFIDD